VDGFEANSPRSQGSHGGCNKPHMWQRIVSKCFVNRSFQTRKLVKIFIHNNHLRHAFLMPLMSISFIAMATSFGPKQHLRTLHFHIEEIRSKRYSHLSI
jgi:hypothetical protein